jgi:hypothetical protein
MCERMDELNLLLFDTVVAGQLNVVRGLKRTNQIVSFDLKELDI